MEPFIGQIILFAGNFPPRGWAFCEGQLLAISSNDALFSLLGTIYGGDGRTTFGLPDLRGSAPIHQGTGPGLSNIRQGARGGSEQGYIFLNQLPNHSHSMTASNLAPSQNTANGASLASGNRSVNKDKSYVAGVGNVPMASNTTASGSSQPHENRPPYIAMNYIIALVGIYPSRT